MSFQSVKPSLCWEEVRERERERERETERETTGKAEQATPFAETSAA